MVKYAGWIALWGILVMQAMVAQAGDVVATLDRDRIVQGETVTLIIQTNDPQQSLDGNFQLLDQDFELLDQRSETQMSILNGRQTALLRVVLTLEPRHSGVITVPALRFGSASTQPLTLTVEAAPEPVPGEAPSVFIEVEVEPRDGPYYVHAQLGLTVRVFYPQQGLSEAAISQPEPAPASVRLLDEVPYQAERGGQHYKVLERHYAVFPERSGPLQIPPMKLSGRLVERRSDGLWQPTVRGRRIEVASEPVELTIQPKPSSFTGDAWLPARSLEVSQTVSAGDALTVGEPVTRTVIVDVVGLEENMITEPPWPAVAGARIYPDQPQGISRNDGKWVLGHKEFRYAVVPEEAGELVLPPLTVHWWDTVNDRAQSAVLPEKRLRVLPSAVVPPPPSPTVAAPAASTESAVSVTARPVVKTVGRYWTWLTFLFAVLWLLTSALLLRRVQARPTRRVAESPAERDEAALLAEIRQACAAAQPARVRHALNRWLREFGPPAAGGSLLAFATHSADSELRQRLIQLDAMGFRPEHEGARDVDWDGPGLWKAFSAWRKQRSQPGERAAADVTDLYANP